MPLSHSQHNHVSASTIMIPQPPVRITSMFRSSSTTSYSKTHRASIIYILVASLIISLWMLWTTTAPSSVNLFQTSANCYFHDDNGSWAVTSNKISSNWIEARYQNFIENCNKAALAHQRKFWENRNHVAGRDDHRETNNHEFDRWQCTHGDHNRIRQNRDQPMSMRNYTNLGYRKQTAPKELMDLLQDFYRTNRQAAHTEWNSVDSYQNTWDVPSYLIRLEDTRLVGGGKNTTAEISRATLEMIQEWTGKEQWRPTSVYGIREYRRGSILAPHVDRLPLIVSAIINIHQDGMEEPWPLEVYGHDGKARNVTMAPGEIILYESHSIIHGRPFPLLGDVYANVFVHFEPIDDENDNGDGVNLPSYLLPGSPWEFESRQARIEEAARKATLSGSANQLKALARMASAKEIIVQTADENGWRLIHEAVRAGHTDIVKLLIEFGADVRQHTYYRQNPLSIALRVWGEDHEMTNYLASRQ